jgi:DNA-binding NtrC family response regulator
MSSLRLSSQLCDLLDTIARWRTRENRPSKPRSLREKIDMLIVDHSLPPGHGRDVAERILQWHPLMKVLHISGYPRSFLEGDDGITPNAGFLGKPFTVQQVKAAVAALLATEVM